MSAALDGLQVLDLAGPFGNYAGKLFADLGADVILVEPPEGARTRHLGPFAEGVPAGEASYRFAYENTSKRSLVLDLATSDGRDTVLSMAPGIDLVLEGFGPGRMEAMGLSGSALRARNRALVLHRLSAFGQIGPYADWAAEDITLLALGGLLYLAGYPDAPPVAAGGFQALACGNLFGAVAAMLAVTQAEATGQGEDVDTSIQESVVMALENSVQFYDFEGTIRKRYAGDQRQAGAGVFACADGSVYLLAGGIAANKFWYNTLAWLRAEGVDVGELEGDDWIDIEFLRRQSFKRTFRRVFEGYTRHHRMVDIYISAQAARVPLCPVNAPRDVRDNLQLQYRNFFTTVPDGMPGRDLTMPGAPYHLSVTPWRISCRPPRLGEHTDGILSSLSMGEMRA